MAKERILIVEDAFDIANLLQVFFTAQGYDVLTAGRGEAALDVCQRQLPNLVLLDVGLPDMSGFDVGKALRASPRTRHIPIVFLTAYGERHNRLKGLGEVQAQYYLVKPFDIEEVHTVVKNLLAEMRTKNQSHPITGLPSGELLSTYLRGLLTESNWALALFSIAGYDVFIQSYGVLVGESVLTYAALLLGNVVQECGRPNDMIGHMAAGPQFAVASSPDRITAICAEVARRFDDEIGVYYDFRDRRQGYVEVLGDQGQPRRAPLMTLSAVVLTSGDGPFYDLGTLMATADDVRARGLPPGAVRRRSQVLTVGTA